MCIPADNCSIPAAAYAGRRALRPGGQRPAAVASLLSAAARACLANGRTAHHSGAANSALRQQEEERPFVKPGIITQRFLMNLLRKMQGFYENMLRHVSASARGWPPAPGWVWQLGGSSPARSLPRLSVRASLRARLGFGAWARCGLLAVVSQSAAVSIPAPRRCVCVHRCGGGEGVPPRPHTPGGSG